jgi:hypothetical protein
MKTSMVFRGLAAVLVFAAAGHAVSAQQSRAAVDPASVPELKAEFDRAAKLGLSVEPLIAKARQGYFGLASTSKIRVAVHTMTDRLVTARQALDPVQGDAELLAGADAIQKGVPDEVLRQLRALQRTRSLAVPLGVLQDLVDRGVSVKDATASVTTLVKRNIADTQIASLSKNVQGDITQGLAPSVAMQLRLKGVLSLPQALAPAAAVAPSRR